MDAVNDPDVKEIAVMSSAQVGKTELLLNTIGFHIGHDPAPILLVQPTKENAEAFSKDRLAPMLRDTPSLRGAVSDARARDANNTISHKVFPGGHITMVGANSPVGLASRPIRIVLCDETDRYPLSAGSEGDPVDLARKRATTFWNKKIILVSTPVIKGQSIIEEAYLASDQRRFYVPCPECGEEQVLSWKNVHWEEGQPSTAEYMCEHCGSLWNDLHRNQAVKQGRWVAENPESDIAGFHLNAIYSPWVELADLVKDFLKAKDSPVKLQTFVNTVLAETWEEEGTRLDASLITSRLTPVVSEEIDASILVITAGADVQNDRIEIEVVGWAADEQSWSLDYHIIMGDPSSDEIWDEVADILTDVYQTTDGRTLKIQSTAIDSGFLTTEVYKFTRTRVGVNAVKGMPGAGRPITNQPSRGKDGNQVFMVGVDTAKDLIFARAAQEEPGAGYMHFPEGRSEEYFAQLLESEEVVQTRYRGRLQKSYKQIRPRNEALDCRVYAIAALSIGRFNLARLQKRKAYAAATVEPKSEPNPRAVKEIKAMRKPRRQQDQSWAQGWRR